MGKLRNDLDFVKPDSNDPATDSKDLGTGKGEDGDWYMERPPMREPAWHPPGKKRPTHATPAGLLSPLTPNAVELIPTL